MTLRSPVYLDADTLVALAEYHDVTVPKKMAVVETTSRKRDIGGQITPSGVGVKASLGRDVEYQTSYTLTPKQKAVVSKIIDGLEAGSVIQNANDALSKGSLVELSGAGFMTACSIAGKMFFVAREALEGVTNLDSLKSLNVMTPKMMRLIKRVYIDNRPVPMPILLELAGTPFQARVFASLEPDFFVDVAAIDRVEGEITVLGQVSAIVAAGEFQSTERWLLAGYEFLTKRILMTKIGDLVNDFMGAIGLNIPEDAIREYIPGPAIVVDAIAVY